MPTSRVSRAAVAIAAIVLFNGSAWLAYAVVIEGEGLTGQAQLTISSASAVAFALGLRHGLDADHLAAIDDAARMLVNRGQDPVLAGFFFALGHSMVVIVLGAGVAGIARELSPRVVGYGELLGSILVATFLLTMGVLNALVWRDLRRTERAHARGEVTQAEVQAVLKSRGMLNRLTRGGATSRLGSSPGMFVVGLMFGLGLGTASEILLLTSATAIGAPSIDPLALMVLPLLFTAGMVTTDTLDGLFMARLYRASAFTPARAIRLSLTTTAITVVITVTVALVYLAGIAAGLGLTALTPVAELRGRFALLGIAIVVIYSTLWAGFSLRWRTGVGRGGHDVPAPGTTEPP